MAIDDGKQPAYGFGAGAATGGYGGVQTGLTDPAINAYLAQRKMGLTRGALAGRKGTRRAIPAWEAAIDEMLRRR